MNQMRSICTLAFLLCASVSAWMQNFVIDAPVPLGATIFAVNAGDFNGNGIDDVVFVGSSGVEIALDPGLLGAPGFALATNILASTTLSIPNRIWCTDWERDGDLDVVVGLNGGTSSGPSSIILLFGNGNGTFGTTAPILVGGQGPFSIPSGAFVEFGDFNGDLATDVAVGSNGISIYYGSPGSLVLTQVLSTTSAASVSGMVVGDFNGDLFDDIVVTIGTTCSAYFGSTAAVPSPQVPVGAWVPFVAADFDGDGFDDVACGSSNLIPATNQVIFGGVAPFLATSPLPTYSGFEFVVATDADEDGILDLLMADEYLVPNATFSFYFSQARLLMFRGRGNRAFSPTPAGLLFAPDVCSLRAAFGDFDGDGDTDAFGTARTAATLPFSNSCGGFDRAIFCKNLVRFGAGCAGQSGVPELVSGSPFPGNTTFSVGLTGAGANVGAVLLASTLAVDSGLCGVLVDTAPYALILPQANYGFTATDALGTASIPLPIPNIPALAGFQFALQWVVFDPAGSLNIAGLSFATTRGAFLTVF